MPEAKNWMVKYWQIVVAVVLVIFNIGYTVAQLDRKPNRAEVAEEIETALKDYDNTLKDNYIEIKKVPGLRETLDGINDKLKSLDDRFNKLEDRIYLK